MEASSHALNFPQNHKHATLWQRLLAALQRSAQVLMMGSSWSARINAANTGLLRAQSAKMDIQSP